MNALAELQRWYQAQCDGFWEHAYGVQIETLDNPGWKLDINLSSTGLESAQFEKLQIDRSDEDWLLCEIENELFKGRGGAGNLVEILEVFQSFVKACGTPVR